MRKSFLIITAVLFTIFRSGAQVPEWVTTHPVSDDAYIGIGQASLTEDDYMRIATENALSDIATQIATKVESNSFFHQVDVDGHAREMFEDRINSNATAWLEGHELKESHTSGNTYYVYYTLDKKTFRRNAEKKREAAIATGLDYLEKGKAAERAMNLTQAAVLYGEGLKAVEPWMFMDLIRDGVNIPVELYDSYINVFSGLVITTNAVQVEGEPFKAVSEPIAGCLSKDGNVIPNIRLKAAFTVGSGTVTPPSETDYNGTAEFYITNITSKEDVQEIRITIDDTFLDMLPEGYRELLERQAWPSAKITVVLKSSPASLYLHVENNDLEGIEKQIRSLLANNYFTLTEDPDAAQCFAELSTVLEVGETVSGGNYDLNTCYCSLTLKIYNNYTTDMLLNYSLDRVKVLAPVHKSYESTVAQGIREVMKRVNRELPKMLGKVRITD